MTDSTTDLTRLCAALENLTHAVNQLVEEQHAMARIQADTAFEQHMTNLIVRAQYEADPVVAQQLHEEVRIRSALRPRRKNRHDHYNT